MKGTGSRSASPQRYSASFSAFSALKAVLNKEDTEFFAESEEDLTDNHLSPSCIVHPDVLKPRRILTVEPIKSRPGKRDDVVLADLAVEFLSCEVVDV